MNRKVSTSQLQLVTFTCGIVLMPTLFKQFARAVHVGWLLKLVPVPVTFLSLTSIISMLNTIMSSTVLSLLPSTGHILVAAFNDVFSYSFQ